LPSLTSASLDAMAAAARGSARALLRPTPGAAIVGLHLEGPFLNPKRKGAADTRFLREPSLSDFEAIVGPYASLVRLIALAPELPGGFNLVDALVARGIRVACGHSDATYEQALEAVAHGASVATHTFNAMSPIHHRAPGMAGAALTCPQLYAEFIADFVHLHPATVRLTLMAKGRDRAVAITDCMKYGGLTEAEQAAMPSDRTVRDGAPRLPDGTLAGSCLPLDQSLRNLVHGLGIPLEDALPAYSENPARMLGLARRGSLAVGHYADIVVLDATLRVRAVWAAGRRMV
jgi:N-acetylglucosamine-6-phosphate deacetylase